MAGEGGTSRVKSLLTTIRTPQMQACNGVTRGG